MISNVKVQCRLTCVGEGVVTALTAEVVAVDEEIAEEVLTDEVGPPVELPVVISVVPSAATQM